MALSIEEKYDEVRQLISIGKEKGYLLYDEVNEVLPADITSSDELDDLFSTFGSAGIEVVDSEQKYREDKLLDRTGQRRLADVALLRRAGEVQCLRQRHEVTDLLHFHRRALRTTTRGRLLLSLNETRQPRVHSRRQNDA